MSDDGPFISYAQNAEDVVLWRALGHVRQGRYVEVGANHPTSSSITRAFYDRGWTGIEVEPVDAFAAEFRKARPADTVVQAAITDEDVDTVVLHVVDGTGLSTLGAETIDRHRAQGWESHDEVVPARRLDDVLEAHLSPDAPVHFMVVDVEGWEASVLRSVDLSVWRPWVLVVEATAPNSTEQTHDQWEERVLAAGYRFCLFDGLSRFYVAEEHAGELSGALTSPANPLDGYVLHETQEANQRLAEVSASLEKLRVEHAEALHDLVRWRGTVLSRWAATGSTSTIGAGTHAVVELQNEVDAMRQTVSWRVTAPLRSVQRRRMQGRL